MAVVLSFVAVGQVNAARKEESGGLLGTARASVFESQLAHAKNRLATRCGTSGYSPLSTWSAAREHATSSLVDVRRGQRGRARLSYSRGVSLSRRARMVSVVTYAVLVWFLLVEILAVS